jgi:hypothetical protein
MSKIHFSQVLVSKAANLGFHSKAQNDRTVIIVHRSLPQPYSSSLLLPARFSFSTRILLLHSLDGPAPFDTARPPPTAKAAPLSPHRQPPDLIYSRRR